MQLWCCLPDVCESLALGSEAQAFTAEHLAWVVHNTHPLNRGGSTKADSKTELSLLEKKQPAHEVSSIGVKSFKTDYKQQHFLIFFHRSFKVGYWIKWVDYMVIFMVYILPQVCQNSLTEGAPLPLVSLPSLESGQTFSSFSQRKGKTNWKVIKFLQLSWLCECQRHRVSLASTSWGSAESKGKVAWARKGSWCQGRWNLWGLLNSLGSLTHNQYFPAVNLCL